MKGRPFRGLVVNALLAASVGSLLSAPGVSAANLITDLSCPSTSLCVALPANGNAVEVANPLVHSRWTENLVDSEGGLLQSISCPSVGFCAAVDLRGNLVTSSRPGDPTAPWRLAHIDGPFTGKSVELEGVSCPSAGLCVAVDNVGNVLSSQAPGSGPRAWHAAHIEGANEFDAVTCAPSSSVCVAVDVNGNAFTSTDPAGGASAWTRATVSGTSFQGVRCVSASLCVAVDNSGNVLTSTPTTSPNSWSVTGNVPVPGSTTLKLPGQSLMSCPSASLCVIPSFYLNQIFASTDPGSNPSAWVATPFPDSSNGIWTVSCPAVTLCVGGSWDGTGFVSTQPAAEAASWTASIAPGLDTPDARHGASALLTGVSLTGVADNAPTLTFTLSSGRGMFPLARMQFSPQTFSTRRPPRPDGLYLANSRQALAKGVSVTSDGQRLSFRASLDSSKDLFVKLNTPASRVLVRISAPLLEAEPALVRAARRSRPKTIGAFLRAVDQAGSPGGNKGQFSLKLRVR